MKTLESARELLTAVKDYAFFPGRWRLAAAFFSGMVLTAVLLPTMVFSNEFTNRDDIAPVPGDPGIFPYLLPGAHQMVFAFSEEAFIPSWAAGDILPYR